MKIIETDEIEAFKSSLVVFTPKERSRLLYDLLDMACNDIACSDIGSHPDG